MRAIELSRLYCEYAPNIRAAVGWSIFISRCSLRVQKIKHGIGGGLRVTRDGLQCDDNVVSLVTCTGRFRFSCYCRGGGVRSRTYTARCLFLHRRSQRSPVPARQLRAQETSGTFLPSPPLVALLLLFTLTLKLAPCNRSAFNFFCLSDHR